MAYQRASLPDGPGGHKRAASLVALVGPTAVGKTAAAITLARLYNAAIVSADSRQIYCGMTIGTAKPSAAEQAAAPHYLIDCCTPDEDFSLADYLATATATIDAIQRRGQLPLLVGGTAQYVQAVVEGWQVPPVPPQPALRAALAAEPPTALHARLQAVDPLAADRIGPTNARRLIRALEVWTATGRPISEWQRKRPPAYPILRLGLHLPREALHRRVSQRVDAMLATGLVAEVEALLAAGYAPDRPAFRSMGYAEIIDHLAGRLTLAEARELIITNTNRFIRHQETWWRRDHAIIWVGADPPAQAQAELAELVDRFLAGAAAGVDKAVE